MRKGEETREKRLNKVLDDMSLNCSNGELFAKQKELLLSLFKEVEPVEVYVPLSDVDKEYAFGSFSIVRTKKEIIYKSNGYRVIVKPWVNRLYQILSFLCDCKDKGESISVDDKMMYEVLLPIAVTFLSLPLNGFSEDEYTANVYKTIVSEMNAMCERLLNKPLQEDDEVANNEFKERIEMLESLKKEMEND